MSQAYKDKLEKNLAKLDSFDGFLQKDKTAELVVNIARSVLSKPGDFQSTEWLLQNGAKLAAYYAYLEGKSNQSRAEAEVAEITHNSVIDGLLLTYTAEGAKVTEARAQAKQALEESAIDVQVRKQKAGYYNTTARAAEKIVSFIQSTLRNKESEMRTSPQIEKGA